MLGTGDTRFFLPGDSIREVSDSESVSLRLTIKSQEEVGLGRAVSGATEVFGLDSALQLRCLSPGSCPAPCLGPATAFRLYWTLSVCGTAKFELLPQKGVGGQPLLQRVALPLGSRGSGEDPVFSGCRKAALLGSAGPEGKSPLSSVAELGAFAGRAGLTTFLGGPAVSFQPN